MSFHGYQLLQEALKNSAMKDRLMLHLKQSSAKLTKNQEVDKSSIKEVKSVLGRKEVDKAIKSLTVLYKKIMKADKLKPAAEAQIISAMKPAIPGNRESRKQFLFLWNQR